MRIFVGQVSNYSNRDDVNKPLLDHRLVRFISSFDASLFPSGLAIVGVIFLVIGIVCTGKYEDFDHESRDNVYLKVLLMERILMNVKPCCYPIVQQFLWH